MSLQAVKSSFSELLNRLDSDDQLAFLLFLRQTFCTDEYLSNFEYELPNVKELRHIADFLKGNAKQSPSTLSEFISPIQTGSHVPVIHIDGFLYSDSDIDDLCDAGKLSRNFCSSCASLSVRPVDFVTHSMTLVRLRCLFQFVLPSLEHKTVLDIGSRLGVVSFAGFFLSKAVRLVGIEINGDMCVLQREVVANHGMQDRVEVIHGDILNREDLIREADVIVLHNPFQYFLSLEEQKRVWLFILKNLQRGTTVIAIPSLNEQLQNCNLSLSTDWLEEVDIENSLQSASEYLFGTDDGLENDLTDITMYRTKRTFEI